MSSAENMTSPKSNEPEKEPSFFCAECGREFSRQASPTKHENAHQYRPHAAPTPPTTEPISRQPENGFEAELTNLLIICGSDMYKAMMKQDKANNATDASRALDDANSVVNKARSRIIALIKERVIGEDETFVHLKRPGASNDIFNDRIEVRNQLRATQRRIVGGE